MTPSARISVVLPVRNGEPHLTEAVMSILNQRFSDLELITVDDHSTDRTREILEEFRSTDCRVKVVSSHGTGFVDAVMTGIDASCGEWIARMDADDRSHPERLEQQLAFLSSEPDVSLLGTAADVIDESGTVVSRIRYPLTDEVIRLALRRHTTFAHGSVIVRRSAMEAVGAYRSDWFPVEDYDLWTRLLAAGFRAANLDRPLYEYRLTPGGVSRVRRNEQVKMSRAVGTSYGVLPGRLPSTRRLVRSILAIDRDVRGGYADARALRRAGASLGSAAHAWVTNSRRAAGASLVGSCMANALYVRRRRSHP